MDIFVSYSFQDGIDISSVLPKSIETQFIYVKKGHIPIWKWSVKRKILSSDCVMCLVTHNVYHNKNIEWELKQALCNGKKVFYFRYHTDSTVPQVLSQHGIEIDSLEHLYEFIFDYQKRLLREKLLRNDGEFIGNGNQEDMKLFFEQYKIMVNTSEELSKRRQNMHAFFVTINGAIFSGFSIVLKNLSDTSNPLLTEAGIGIFISILGCMLAYSWEKQIVSYRQLSSGKFKIINTMEDYLPASVFAAEWLALGCGKDKKIYCSFTENERYIPKVLIWIYVTLFLLGVVYIFLNVYQFTFRGNNL